MAECKCKPSPADEALKEAEAKKVEAERLKVVQETRKARAEAIICEIERDEAVEGRDADLAANSRHKVYIFDTEIDSGSVKKCIAQLTQWHRQEPGCPIEIQINSPGGVITAGFVLVDYLRDLRNRGHEITMVTYGMAASMAAVVLQAADRRVMGENAFLLLHEGSMGAIGDFGDIEDRVDLMKMYHERILALFEDRAKPINPKTTAKFIRNRWARKDWWLMSDAALKLGLVDEIR